MLNRVAIIGVGLIGGSLAAALKSRGHCFDIVGCGRNPKRLAEAQQMGLLDRWETDWSLGVGGADMVVIGVPVLSMEAAFRAIAPILVSKDAARATVTDVGSTKVSVLDAARRVFGRVPAGFVPGHPIAGGEQSGFEHADADLFVGRKVILTPESATAAGALAGVRAMWEAVGAEVVELAADRHDRVLAATSHLPHVLAYTLVSALAKSSERDEIFRFGAGGLRDLTRVASSDPTMWADICIANAAQVADALRGFGAMLEAFMQVLQRGDHAALMSYFEQAKQTRDRYYGKASD